MSNVDLRLGDCLELMRAMPDQIVDAVITSPMYPGASMWNLSDEELMSINLMSLKECSRITRDNGVICWQIADVPSGNHGIIPTTTTTTTIFAANELGLKMRAQIIWDKASSNLVPVCFMRRPVVPSLTHEFVLVFFKGDWVPREKECGLDGDKKWMTQSVWRIPTVRDDKHPAPFPVELARRCVALWTLDSEIVLDPFMGTGSTGLACWKMNRNFIGMEINEQYFAIAQRRIAEAQAQLALPLGVATDA